MVNPDETTEFWSSYSCDALAEIAAVLHRDRREQAIMQGEREVSLVRAVIADIFIQGSGLEVGAGSRPFPLPPNTHCFYGDERDHEQLVEYFGGEQGIPDSVFLDAQTLSEVEDDRLDFVISAHVIEHLHDPIGSIKNTLKKIKTGGNFILVVPDRHFTFDKARPPTSLEHLLQDEKDGGASSTYQSYFEHVKYVHPLFDAPIPEDQIDSHVRMLMNARHDIHMHCWNGAEFAELLRNVLINGQASVAGHTFIRNENKFVIRKC